MRAARTHPLIHRSLPDLAKIFQAINAQAVAAMIAIRDPGSGIVATVRTRVSPAMIRAHSTFSDKYSPQAMNRVSTKYDPEHSGVVVKCRTAKNQPDHETIRKRGHSEETCQCPDGSKKGEGYEERNPDNR